MKTNLTQPHTILWADDDPDDRHVICDIVSTYSDQYRVDEVDNGSEVLHYLQRIGDSANFPCLVVLDINMPKLTGLETLAYLKENNRYKDLKVAVFTTSNNAMDRAFCERYDVPMMTKPSSYAEFEKAVTDLLKLCKLEGHFV